MPYQSEPVTDEGNVCDFGYAGRRLNEPANAGVGAGFA